MQGGPLRSTVIRITPEDVIGLPKADIRTGQAGSTAGAQATKGPLLRRTISSSLKPGIYPLFERPADKEGKINCDATPHLSAALSGAVITTMESWTELPLSRPEQ